MQFFDSHCHVYDERMPGGPVAAVQAARDAGVVGMLAVGCDRATSQSAIAIAAEHDDVFATVGLHPHEAVHGVGSIVDLLDTPGIVAIGEAGLDYYYDHSPRDVQREAFAAQIHLAHERDLPLVIHTRDAWDDTFAVLADAGVPDRTIFHCFTGGPAEAERCVAIGAYVSLSGIVTFPTAVELRDGATRIPIERLLVETDAPYLAPVPHRGRKNQPAYVEHVARCVADLRDQPLAEIAAATVDNARRAFPGVG
jgi:TatD DNase family protein